MMHNNSALQMILFGFMLGLVSPSSWASDTPLPPTDFPTSVVTLEEVSSGISIVWYDGATTRYAHGVLGDAIEPSELHARTVSGKSISLTLDDKHVFEDIAPRLADIDGDGQNEIITIRSHQNTGAQIAVYGITTAQPSRLSLIASTPYIGRPYRWLAPIGIADFNGDGAMDIAYIDRPHLAKLLRIWSYTPTGLKQIAQQSGLTNHRIGDNFITGGVQRCNGQLSMITVNANWSRIIKTYFSKGKLMSDDIGAYVSTSSINSSLNCQ